MMSLGGIRGLGDLLLDFSMGIWDYCSFHRQQEFNGVVTKLSCYFIYSVYSCQPIN